MDGVMTYAMSFSGWLLQTTLIASVLVCLILVIQKILGGRLGPRWCQALWLMLLIRMILPWAPSSRVSLLNLIPSWDRQAQLPQIPGIAEQQEVSPLTETAENPEARLDHEPQSKATIREVVTPRLQTLDNMEGKFKSRLVSFRPVFPILWLAGAIVIGAYLLMSTFTLWRIVKRDRPLLNQSILELFEECKTQMGVQSLVVVVPSSQISSPALFGFIRPRLLLPLEMLEKASVEEMRYVFLHELAHLKRHDIYLGWLTSLLQVLHWFNPLVWFAFYRMRADRELACDALVLARTQKEESQEYGQAIVSLVRRFSRSRPLPAMAGVIESRSQLKRRITMITEFKNNSYRWSPLATILIVILAFVSLPNSRNAKAQGKTILRSKSPITLRRIMGYTPPNRPKVSADGKYLCGVAWEDKHQVLYTLELATGQKKVLVSDENIFWQFVISPDSRMIAYNHLDNETELSDLRIVSFDESGERTLCSNKRHIVPLDWSNDGEQILGWRPPTDREGKTYPYPKEMVWVSTDNGSVKTITILPQKRGFSSYTIDLSPNSRYIAYDARDPEVALAKIDIFVFDIDKNQEAILEYDGNNRLIGWTPDGKYILFTSEHGGTRDLLLVRIANGKPEGQPELVKRDSELFDPIGLTQDGALYYAIFNRPSTIYTAALDLEVGRIMSSPEPILQRKDVWDTCITWSPDGKYLTYCDSSRIQIKPFKGGVERIIETNLPFVRWICWTPDGKSLIASWFSPGGGGSTTTDLMRSVYEINVETGKKRVLLKSDIGSPIRSEFSPDAKSLIYNCVFPNKYLVVRELKTGKERKIFKFREQSGWKFCWDLSSDGKRIAIGAPGINSPSQLKIISLEGKEIKELLPKDWGRIFDVMWTPDGKSVLFAAKEALWQISAEGGEPQKLFAAIGLGVASRTSICLSPDGQRIAYLTSESDNEVWVMENFLPKDLAK